MMDKNFIELLSALNACHAKYLIVGGYAVAVHAQPRGTKDIDIFYKAEPENAQAVYQALADFGAPLAGLTYLDFMISGKIYQFGRAPYQVDFMHQIDGVEFDDAWQKRLMISVDATLQAPYISSDLLVQNKLASGRPQDLADVDAVRNARKAVTKPSPNK